MLLVEALMQLASGKTLEGRLYQGKWLEYRVSDEGTEILRQGEPVRLEDLIELEWREAVKTPDVWVKEAKALLEMGAHMVDAPTLAGVLAKLSELEMQANEAFERGKKDAMLACVAYVWDLVGKNREGLVPANVYLEDLLHGLALDIKAGKPYKDLEEWNLYAKGKK